MSKDLRNLISPYVHAPVYKKQQTKLVHCSIFSDFEGELVPKCGRQRELQCRYPLDPYERREFLDVRHLDSDLEDLLHLLTQHPGNSNGSILQYDSISFRG